MQGMHETVETAMGAALAEAFSAGQHGDVPVGAVVLDPDGRVIGRGANHREVDGDVFAHAEIDAMHKATGQRRLDLGQETSRTPWNLADCTLVVTLEPCPMCAGAALQAHIGRIVFGAWDAKMGACGSVWDIPRDPHIGTKPEVVGGVQKEECTRVLQDFFARRRDAENSSEG